MSKIDVDESVKTLESGTLPQWIADHLKSYRESGGKEGHYWDSSPFGGPGLLPCLLLETVGRRSGKSITHPLIYGVDGDRYVIVASKGGAPTQPAWYFNLVANPDVTLEVGTETIAARARLAGADERERLWALMVNIYPVYTEYQAKTEREIPIFVLDRK